MTNKTYMITNKSDKLSGIVSNVDENTVKIVWENDSDTVLTNEELKELLEDKDYEVSEVEIKEDTPAQDTIRAHVKPDATEAGEADGNPKTRFDWIRQYVGALADLDTETLESKYEEMLAMIGGEGDRAGLGNNAPGNQASIDAKPSGALGTPQAFKYRESGLGESALVKLQKTEQDKIFGETELTENAKEKISTLFEGAVNSRIAEEIVSIEEKYGIALEQNIDNLTESLVEKLDAYLDHVAQSWMNENEVAIVSEIRSELVMSFMDSLKTVFEQHYIEIPEDKVNVVEALVQENEALKKQINENLNSDIEKTKALKEGERKEVLNKLSEGMTIIQKSKFKRLLENVEFENAEKFTEKANTLKENFITETVKTSTTVITETMDPEPKKPTVHDEGLKSVLSVLDSYVKE